MTSRPRWWLLAAHLALKSKPHSKSLPHPLLARAPAAFARHPQQASGQSESSLSRDGWRSALGPTSAAGLGPIRKQTLERWMEECACVRAPPPPPPPPPPPFFFFLSDLCYSLWERDGRKLGPSLLGDVAEVDTMPRERPQQKRELQREEEEQGGRGRGRGGQACNVAGDGRC